MRSRGYISNPTFVPTRRDMDELFVCHPANYDFRDIQAYLELQECYVECGPILDFTTTLTTEAAPLQTTYAETMSFVKGITIHNSGPGYAFIMDSGVLIAVISPRQSRRMPVGGAFDLSGYSDSGATVHTKITAFQQCSQGGGGNGGGNGNGTKYTSDQTYVVNCPSGTTGGPYTGHGHGVSKVSQGMADLIAQMYAKYDAEQWLNTPGNCVVNPNPPFTLNINTALVEPLASTGPYYVGYGDGVHPDPLSYTHLMAAFACTVSGTGTEPSAGSIEIIFERTSGGYWTYDDIYKLTFITPGGTTVLSGLVPDYYGMGNVSVPSFTTPEGWSVAVDNTYTPLRRTMW